MRRETIVRLPSIFNNDLAFFKNIPIGEKRAIQLRWEMYNIFNHRISETLTVKWSSAWFRLGPIPPPLVQQPTSALRLSGRPETLLVPQPVPDPPA